MPEEKVVYWRGRFDTKRVSKTAMQIMICTLEKQGCRVENGKASLPTYLYNDCTITLNGEDVFDIYSREKGKVERTAKSFGISRLDSIVYGNHHSWMTREEGRMPRNPSVLTPLSTKTRTTLEEALTKSQPKCITQYARGPMPSTHSVEGN